MKASCFSGTTATLSDDSFDLIIVLATFFIIEIAKSRKNIPQFNLFKRYLKRAFEAQKHIAIVNIYRNLTLAFLQRFHGNLSYIL